MTASPDDPGRTTRRIILAALFAAAVSDIYSVVDRANLHAENLVSIVERKQALDAVADYAERFHVMAERLERIDQGGSEMATRIERLERKAEGQ